MGGVGARAESCANNFEAGLDRITAKKKSVLALTG